MKNNKYEPKKIIYYTSELDEDFAATKDIKHREINSSYNYFRKDKFFIRLLANFLYYIIAKPIVILLMKIMYHYKVINKNAMRKRGKKGCFIYSNHTNYIPDACFNSTLHLKRNYVVVGSQVVNIKGIVNLVQDLGAIPLGDSLDAKINFLRSIKKNLSKNASITIYPEAHIWPYCTFIRNFKVDAFRYPLSYNCPVFTTTTCYQKRKHSSKPKIVFVVDGPFYPDYSINKVDAIKKLRDEVFNSLDRNVKKYSTYDYYKYIKKED